MIGNVPKDNLIGLLISLIFASFRALAVDAPTNWVDPATGHRVIRLTHEPGSDSFYFNYNS